MKTGKALIAVVLLAGVFSACQSAAPAVSEEAQRQAIFDDERQAAADYQLCNDLYGKSQSEGGLQPLRSSLNPPPKPCAGLSREEVRQAIIKKAPPR